MLLLLANYLLREYVLKFDIWISPRTYYQGLVVESLADRRGKPDICEEEASYDRTRKTLHHIECKENFENDG